MRHDPHLPGGSGGLALWLFGGIGMLVVLGLLALLTYFLVKRFRAKRAGVPAGFARHPGHGPVPAGPPALLILDQRLAAGEIEVEDYLTRRSALLGEAGPTANEWTPHPGDLPQPPASPPAGGSESAAEPNG
ncbi:MAG TPA: hypothetical protein PLE12_08030 [Propionicimonas sp.]|nr:hypothetical protein [Propionicimonas sp.]